MGSLRNMEMVVLCCLLWLPSLLSLQQPEQPRAPPTAIRLSASLLRTRKNKNVFSVEEHQPTTFEINFLIISFSFNFFFSPKLLSYFLSRHLSPKKNHILYPSWVTNNNGWQLGLIGLEWGNHEKKKVKKLFVLIKLFIQDSGGQTP